MRLLTLFALATAVGSVAAEKYTGPRPPKADVLYLMHADNLIETEVREAKTENRKDIDVGVIDGASSPVRTPLAEPVFLLKSDQIGVDKLSAFKLDPKNGRREVVVGSKKGKAANRPIHLVVKRLEDKLYRVEVDQPLENGEYTISPDGSNMTFSFQIY